MKPQLCSSSPVVCLCHTPGFTCRPSSVSSLATEVLQTFWQNFENGENAKILVFVMRPLKIFPSKTAKQNS